MATIFRKYFRTKDYEDIANIQIATNHRIINCKLDLDELGDGSTISIILSAWIFIYIGFNIRTKWFWNLLRKFNKPNTGNSKYVERSIGFSFSDWTLRVSLWEDETGWSRSNPKWWAFYIDFKRLLLGKETYSKKYIQEKIFDIPLREGVYSCLIQEFESYWKYKRFGYFANKKITRYDCLFGREVDKDDKFDKWRYSNKFEWSYEDIPNNGRNITYWKNECVPATSKPKWDDNSTCSICGFHQAKSINEAAAMLLQSLFKSRLDYFGDKYEPINN